MNRVDVLGVGIDDLTMKEAVDRALMLILEHRCAYMVTPNPEIVMAAWDDPEVAEAIKNADLVIPDGTGVMQAAKNVRPPNCRPKIKIAVMSSGTSNMYPKVPTCTEGKMLCMTIPRP